MAKDPEKIFITKESSLMKLEERISEGEEILNYEYYDAYHLGLLILSYERWDKSNIQLIKEIFGDSDNLLITEYHFLKLNEYIFTLSDDKQISIYIDYIKRKIELIKKIYEEIQSS